jgi:hypothetical protein
MKTTLTGIKRKVKTDPHRLFEKHNRKIIKETGGFLIVVPLDWECTVFSYFFACGGEGAQWCIDNANDAVHWISYLANKTVFICP